MLKSFNSPPDNHNDHLRNLLDQRNARADVQGRLSAAVSDLSDTTSVYSHSYFSPRLSENGGSYVGHAYASSVSDVGTERYEPHTSILDLTHDRRTSYASQNVNTTSSTDDSEIIARMSYLGPKMRVHSRAPWEEEALEEEDEEIFQGTPSFSRHHAAKNFASAFSSPRPSLGSSVSRQSEDSSNSQFPSKQSFETIDSQVSLSHTRGGLYALAQESMSSNSLGRRMPVKESFLHKLSIGRLRNDSSAVTIVPNVPPIPSPMSSSANNLISTGDSRDSSPNNTHSVGSASSSHDSLEFLSVRKTSTHPYANPDLVASYSEAARDASGPSDTHYTLPHCDSEVTVKEPFSMEPMAKYNTQAKIPGPPVNSVVSNVRVSPISTKNISSPVSVVSSPQNLHAGGAERSLPGWTERSSTAPFTLISLEEARAKRMRTSTDTGVATLSSDSGTPFPGNGTNYSTFSSSSPLANLGSKARARSISAGPNSKTALHNILGQPKSESQSPEQKEEFIAGPPSGKTLRNKKSGFMRIFNRDKDLQNVPPVPSLPDRISQSHQSQQPAIDNMQCMPVPSLSQPEVSRCQNGALLQTDMAAINKNMKRTSPSLSINTTTQGSPARPFTPSGPHPTLGVPSFEPQSAPANIPEFPVLRLRPVSTLFSASFGDLVPSEMADSPPSSKSPLTTPTSPFGPLYDVASVAKDEKHPSIKAPQEQMLSSKNAWERHIWELEGQVRGLKAELEALKSNDEYCDKCGRGQKPLRDSAGIANRPRARTGMPSRSVNPRT